MINHVSCLKTTLRQHPYMLNCTNPVSGEALLQNIVRGQNLEKVQIMLSTNCRLGLIQDNKGQTALKTALKYRQKQVVRMLLSTMLRDVEKHPAALEPFMRHRVEICDHYPDLFLEIIRGMTLIREEELTPSGKNTALLHGTTQFLTAGSSERSPKSLWLRVLEAGSRQLRTRTQQQHDPQTARQSRGMRMLKSGYRLDLTDPESHQRIMVCSLLVPFENAVGISPEGVSRPESTLLCLIVRAASNIEDFTIFDALVVKGILQFKWDNYGAAIFQTTFVLDAVHLLCFSVFAYMGVQHSLETWPTTIVVTGALSVIGSAFSLTLEIRQLLLDGARAYFNGPGGAGNYIDMFALSTQICVVILFVYRNDNAMKEVAAWSVLASFFKILNLSRGFESFGPLVRMIAKIIKDVQNFFVVLLVMLVGFTMAFSVALPEGSIMNWLFLMVNNGLYGEISIVQEFTVANAGQIILFQVLMFWACLIMLNLLIGQSIRCAPIILTLLE